jgi:hypothetical protein
MSCGGGHLGFPIGIKNRNFVEEITGSWEPLVLLYNI